MRRFYCQRSSSARSRSVASDPTQIASQQAQPLQNCLLLAAAAVADSAGALTVAPGPPAGDVDFPRIPHQREVRHAACRDAVPAQVPGLLLALVHAAILLLTCAMDAQLLFELAAVALLHSALPVLVLRVRSHGVELSSTYGVPVEARWACRTPTSSSRRDPCFSGAPPGAWTSSQWRWAPAAGQIPQVLTNRAALHGQQRANAAVFVWFRDDQLRSHQRHRDRARDAG